MVAVDLTPASHRPFVGSSTDNSELGLTFGYNGLGRVDGQNGGPGSDRRPDGAAAVRRAGVAGRRARLDVATEPLPKPSPHVAPKVKRTINENPVAFGSSPGPLRLFRGGLGDQDAWMLAFALRRHDRDRAHASGATRPAAGRA